MGTLTLRRRWLAMAGIATIVLLALTARGPARAGAPPGNDALAGARAIAGLPYSDTADTTAATVQIGEPDPSCINGELENSVWYRYVAPGNGYLSVDVEGSDYDAFLAAYEGNSFGSFNQVGCSYRLQGDPGEAAPMGIRIYPGETYYIQAGGSTEDGGAASGELDIRFEDYSVPACPPTHPFMYDLPDDDMFNQGSPRHDIWRVGPSATTEEYCLKVRMDRTTDITRLSSVIAFDTDVNRNTGMSEPLAQQCGRRNGIGAEVVAYISGKAGLFHPVTTPAGDWSLGLVVPGRDYYILSVPFTVMGNSNLNWAVSVGDGNLVTTDCMANGGAVHCVGDSCSYVPFHNGDANCSGLTDSIDAALVLQHNAGLGNVACTLGADASDNNAVNSVDAQLILQYGAGLIALLPPA